MERVLFELVRQCVDQRLVKSKVLLIDSTHTFASQKQDALDVLKDAAKRLHRAVTKKHPKLEKKLPKPPKPSGQKMFRKRDATSSALEAVEKLLPNAEAPSRTVRLCKAYRRRRAVTC